MKDYSSECKIKKGKHKGKYNCKKCIWYKKVIQDGKKIKMGLYFLKNRPSESHSKAF